MRPCCKETLCQRPSVKWDVLLNPRDNLEAIPREWLQHLRDQLSVIVFHSPNAVGRHYIERLAVDKRHNLKEWEAG